MFSTALGRIPALEKKRPTSWFVPSAGTINVSFATSSAERLRFAARGLSGCTTASSLSRARGTVSNSAREGSATNAQSSKELLSMSSMGEYVPFSIVMAMPG